MWCITLQFLLPATRLLFCNGALNRNMFILVSIFDDPLVNVTEEPSSNAITLATCDLLQLPFGEGSDKHHPVDPSCHW